MSIFGSFQCPKCGSEWVGSIGWIYSGGQKELDKLLLNLCGCEGKIDEVPFDKRKEKMKQPPA